MKTLNVGFRTESFGPFAHLFKKTAREKYDLDLKAVPKFGKGEEAELSILGGELDFLLGNHYTPIAARAGGIRICWLAIPMSEHFYQIATRPEVDFPVARGVDARQLFELGVLRELEREGFIDRVWANMKG